MKNIAVIVFITIVSAQSVLAGGQPQVINAKQVVLKLSHHQIIQAIGGYEIAEGVIEISNPGETCNWWDRNITNKEECVRLRIPVIVKGYRLGAGLKFTAESEGQNLKLMNWDGKRVYDFFGKYYGANALEIDFAFFGVKGISALGVNSSKVILGKGVSGYTDLDEGGYGANVASLRILTIWPGQSLQYDSTKTDYYKTLLIRDTDK